MILLCIEPVDFNNERDGHNFLMPSDFTEYRANFITNQRASAK